MLLAVPAFAQYSETITVGRVLLSVRIVDRGGKAIAGLHPEDLAAQIDGKPVEVMSVTWVPETGPREPDPEFLEALARHAVEAPREGRLFVFYFQTDFARNTPRVSGQMNALIYVDRIIDEVIQPDDRVAVLSFDSHLKLHLDFTGDKAQIRKAAQRTLSIREPPSPPAVPGPSLAMCLDREKMRRFTRDEEALLHIAEALREIPGEKQMIFVGTRLGYQIGARVFAMDALWAEVKRELLAANVTFNGFYAMAPGMSGSLAVGVEKAAAETGGFFVRADPRGLARLRDGEFAGHYEIELRVPQDLPIGTYPISIRGAKRKDIAIHAILTLSENE